MSYQFSSQHIDYGCGNSSSTLSSQASPSSPSFSAGDPDYIEAFLAHWFSRALSDPEVRDLHIVLAAIRRLKKDKGCAT